MNISSGCIIFQPVDVDGHRGMVAVQVVHLASGERGREGYNVSGAKFPRSVN